MQHSSDHMYAHVQHIQHGAGGSDELDQGECHAGDGVCHVMNVRRMAPPVAMC